MSDVFMKQKAVAKRWGISPRTLERWRVVGEGPRFLKVGANVLYRLRDVEAWEATRVCQSTADAALDERRE
jgi:hypothetical protein